MPSRRPNGGKNKCWTKEEKEKIVLYHLNNGIVMDKYAKHFRILKGQIFKWVTDYKENGIEGLINKKKPGEESIKYSNIINDNWNTTRPFEKIVSDTTTFYFKKKKYDWTFYLDVFNNEIDGYDVREFMCGNGILNHRQALNNMLKSKIKRGYKALETIVHTDQGTVYSSVSFNNIFNSYTVTRSMSKAGTPTGNPVIESKMTGLKKKCILILR